MISDAELISPRHPGTPRRLVALVVATCALALMLAPWHPDDARAAAGEPDRAAPIRWTLPIPGAVIVDPYRAPAHSYGPGHRGIDLSAGVGGTVRAPAAGTVAFAGTVANRGVLTIDHGGGLVSTLEPVDALVSPGLPVAAGAIVATVSTGGHAARGTVHLGARLDGEYLNPLVLIDGVARAVLLPCC